MENVLTLIGPPGGLNETIVASAQEALAGLGADVGALDWLSENEACDIPFAHASTKAAETAVRDTLGPQPVDLWAGALAGRRKKLLVADMDSTIVTVECLDELADSVGKKQEIAAITESAMRGEIEYQESLKQRVAMLEGLAESAILETLAMVELTPGADTLVKTMTANGAYALLVSSGFTVFTEPVANWAGFDDHRGNRVEIVDGHLSGRVIEPILDKEGKLKELTTIAEERNIPLSLTMAVGDGANDVPMIQAAGLGIAYKAKPVTRQAAIGSGGATIDHAGLTAALYMQGYNRREFAG